MIFYDLLPHEYDYALSLSYVLDLWHYDPMILHMVLERYPIDEDAYASVEDSAADSNSAIVEDEDLSHDEDMAISAPEAQSSSLCNHIHFGNFGNSDLTIFRSSPITPIKPTIDGFSIKIGEITCILADSCCIVEESAFEESDFAASEEHMTSKNLDSASSCLLSTSEIVIMPLVEGGSVKIGELDCFISVSESVNKQKSLDMENQELVVTDLFSNIQNINNGEESNEAKLYTEFRFTSDMRLSLWFEFEKLTPEKTVVYTTAAMVKFSDSSAFIFDRSGTLTNTYCFTVMLSFLSKLISIYFTVRVFVFDPGGNHHDFCSPLILLYGGIWDRVDTIFLLVKLIHGEISVLVNGIKIQLRLREYGKKMTEN
jgi:hypothetical protein